MILCLMLRFAFLHLSRWLHRSIGIWGHNQKTALLIPLQQQFAKATDNNCITRGLDILHKTTKPFPLGAFRFSLFAGRSPPVPTDVADRITQSDNPQDPVNASLRTWKHSRPEQLLLTRLSGCDSALPTSPKGVGWILSPKQSPDFRPFSPGGEYINSTSGHPSPCVTSASVLETRSPGAAWQYHKRSSLCQPITKSMYVHTKKLSGSNSSLERQPKFPSVELPPDPSQPHVNVALSIRH
ncbi:hypothetical protein CIRG_02634 [Coccidioides immitis RMSCC 2394]|uniref:Uncharacterized protein n=1 Tax=Coccidioides immitis RMSCC 2394 TaxID=404692 RepID=A0A0J7AZM5_COCIT|nr:hypothetical protein CIRG_02634 [Coccidioides immitis RMSCC 2394]